MKRVGLTMAVCLLVCGTVLAARLFSPGKQTSNPGSKRAEPVKGQQPFNCETAVMFLDLAKIDAEKLPDAYLIIVSRLGKGEPANLNQIRLANTAEYVRRGTDLKYVLATGERTAGLGRLELYVGGRLYKSMPFEKNAKGYCVHAPEG
jgi:hypothetical protein